MKSFRHHNSTKQSAKIGKVLHFLRNKKNAANNNVNLRKLCGDYFIYLPQNFRYAKIHLSSEQLDGFHVGRQGYFALAWRGAEYARSAFGQDERSEFFIKRGSHAEHADNGRVKNI